MWWSIAMGVIIALAGSLAARNRSARSRFEMQYPKGISNADLSAEVRGLLRDGRQIPALQRFRKETGLGLKDAKEILNKAMS